MITIVAAAIGVDVTVALACAVAVAVFVELGTMIVLVTVSDTVRVYVLVRLCEAVADGTHVSKVGVMVGVLVAVFAGDGVSGIITGPVGLFCFAQPDNSTIMRIKKKAANPILFISISLFLKVLMIIPNKPDIVKDRNDLKYTLR